MIWLLDVTPLLTSVLASAAAAPSDHTRWTLTVGDTVLELNCSERRRCAWLNAIVGGRAHRVGDYWSPEAAAAAVGQWRDYLQSGGSVAAWQASHMAGAA